jgi:hypothetical protein
MTQENQSLFNKSLTRRDILKGLKYGLGEAAVISGTAAIGSVVSLSVVGEPQTDSEKSRNNALTELAIGGGIIYLATSHASIQADQALSKQPPQDEKQQSPRDNQIE